MSVTENINFQHFYTFVILPVTALHHNDVIMIKNHGTGGFRLKTTF